MLMFSLEGEVLLKRERKTPIPKLMEYNPSALDGTLMVWFIQWLVCIKFTNFRPRGIHCLKFTGLEAKTEINRARLSASP